MFTSPLDIADRALQHCGAPRINRAFGFDEDSKGASEIAFCYDKLRLAELRRNVWRFAIQHAVLRPIGTGTMLLAPALWSATPTYFVGSIVRNPDGVVWISTIPNNLNVQPGVDTSWKEYFGPLTVSAYDSTTTYFAGELVYIANGAGANNIYLSLVNSNAANPATATAWSATATYFKNQVVTYSSIAYMSLIDLNTNQTPSSAPALFNIATTYAAAARVGASDGVIYTSVGSGNVGHDPTLDSLGTYWTSTGVLNPWTTAFSGGTGAVEWLLVGGASFPYGVGLTPPYIIYPVGAGPSQQSSTRNVYRLPAGYLRQAPQDPKAGGYSYLGAPSNRLSDDWLFEGDYLVSGDFSPFVLRFVADTADVTRFDPMFCEGLAARIGLEVCEPVTQSTEKLKTIDAEYTRAIGDARTANGIETGFEEPALDDYLACRL